MVKKNKIPNKFIVTESYDLSEILMHAIDTNPKAFKNGLIGNIVEFHVNGVYKLVTATGKIYQKIDGKRWKLVKQNVKSIRTPKKNTR